MQFLQALNEAQSKAVLHDPSVPLQILAGPGSGKTKVLTSRIAYLIIHHKIPPNAICAVTFTNKAANEMRMRLAKLLGPEQTSQIRMGTFHALCAQFLRRHGNKIGVNSSFTICDIDEAKKIISTHLSRYKADLKDTTLKDATVLASISNAKAKGLTSDDLFRRQQNAPSTELNEADRVVTQVYSDYETSLRQHNSMDFDDLLVFGVKLFREHRETVQWCKHILVDEFQDTNTTQYELMRAIAINRCLTIVGDPDQSIYGWRAAEVTNLGKMRKDFVLTEQIFLERNYRSAGNILSSSLAIVAEDKDRIPKSLQSSHPAGKVPVLRAFSSEHAEASFIATEIRRLVANMGGVLQWCDFVILLRFNALSRPIEAALQKEGIPSRVLAGHKFFERLEIKDLLAYLQLIDNPQFFPAFARAVNVPARGIGEKTLAEIAARAEKSKLSALELVEKICDGKTPDIKPAVKVKLKRFVAHMRELREYAANGAVPADLIRKLVELTQYEEHLKRTQQDADTRWENVKELINFATEEDVVVVDDEADTTPLRRFLQASMLSSEGDKEHEDDKNKVTISTCHAAKGLEWPVVMVPSVEQGTFPFYRTEDTAEERRLLYVACTRAQGLLYLTHAAKRKVGGEQKTKEVSSFLAAVTKKNKTLFTLKAPEFNVDDRRELAQVLGRRPPNEAEVERRVADLYALSFVAFI
ncbi:P-loop containing nucleoside triphosphate hydrolase protein [Schizophyllum amplum]|uniref:DNA 3'-5' helicase n=1 Tax=Schizophyllum amplum TaxID=97359 RepID=A0A550CIW4_9AGAR|nr:P-loop containing nucleoside triphosphate hydrolase protein [Auriculariopsis ampla]